MIHLLWPLISLELRLHNGLSPLIYAHLLVPELRLEESNASWGVPWPTLQLVQVVDNGPRLDWDHRCVAMTP